MGITANDASEKPMPNDVLSDHGYVRDEFSHFSIQHLACLLAEGLLELFLLACLSTVADGTNRRVHAVVCTDLERDLCDLLEIVLCTSGDLAEEDFFGHTTSESHTHAIDQLRSREEISLSREILNEWKCKKMYESAEVKKSSPAHNPKPRRHEG